MYGTYPPSKGNDGDRSNCNRLVAWNSVIITHPHLYPWYAVDLGVALKIAGVKLTNRGDEVAVNTGLLSVTHNSSF